MIHTCRPCLGEEEKQAMNRVYDSKWLISGAEGQKFEEEFAEYLGVRYAIATASCTHALQIAYKTIIPPQSMVYTTPLTFMATINSMLWSGLNPVFLDVDEWGNMLKPPDYAQYLVPVHFAGRPIDWTPEPHQAVIYDCAHTVGVDGPVGKVGSYGHANAFSFHISKVMTTGQGGMITTDNPQVAKRAKYLRIHGMTKDAFARGEERTPFYDQAELGIKANMLDLLAAIGRVQLRKLRGMNAARFQHAKYYDTQLQDCTGLVCPPILEQHTYHLYTVKVREDLAKYRDEIIQKCHALGVELAVHVKPIYWLSFYKYRLGDLTGSCPNAENFFSRCMTLPNYPDMTQEELERVVNVLRDVMKEYQ